VYPSLWLAIVAPNVLLFQLQWCKGQQIRYDWLDLGGLFVVYNLTPRPSYSFSAGNSKPPVVTSGDWLRIQGQKKNQGPLPLHKGTLRSPHLRSNQGHKKAIVLPCSHITARTSQNNPIITIIMHRHCVIVQTRWVAMDFQTSNMPPPHVRVRSPASQQQCTFRK